MNLESITRSTVIAAISWATFAPIVRAIETSPLTVEEAITGLYPEGGFSVAGDGRHIQILTSAPYESNGRVVIIDVETGQAQDISSNNISWALSGEYGYRLHSFGPEQKIVGFTKVEGKTWAALRSPSSPENPELLFNFPMSMGCWYLGNLDGNMIFQLYQSSGTKPRSLPEEDNPPVFGVKTRMRVHSSYFPDVNRNPFKKSYENAYARNIRDYYVVFNPKTKELRRICSANDSRGRLDVNGKRLILWQWRTAEEFKNAPGDRTVYGDCYLIPIPAESELPLIDLLEVSRSEPLVAGWTDHKNRIIKPAMPALEKISGAWTTSPDGRKLSSITDDRMYGKDQLVVIDVATGRVSDLSDRIPLSTVQPRITSEEDLLSPTEIGRQNPVGWTADSSALLVTRAGYLWKIPVDGGPVENLSAKGSVAIRKMFGIAASHVPIEFDGDILVITTDETKGTDGLARFNLKTGKLTPVVEDAGYIYQAALGGKNDKILYMAVTPNTVPQVFLRDLREGGVKLGKQVTRFKPDLEGRELPFKKLITFSTKDGGQHHGLLFLPKKTARTKKYPLVLGARSLLGDLKYGYMTAEGRGLANRYRTSGALCYSRQADFFVRAGYAVFVFDFELPGGGAANANAKEFAGNLFDRFANANTKEFVGNLFDAAADAAIAEGQVDPEKLTVVADGDDMMIGNFTMMALTQSSRFKAAMISGGIGLPMAQALSSDDAPWAYVHFMGRPSHIPQEINPVKTRERYMDSAALPLMSTLKTPVLFMTADLKTANGRTRSWDAPSTRTDELFNASIFAGTKSIAAFSSHYIPFTEQAARTLLWFNEHLNGGPALAWRADLPRELILNEDTGESIELEAPASTP